MNPSALHLAPHVIAKGSFFEENKKVGLHFSGTSSRNSTIKKTFAHCMGTQDFQQIFDIKALDVFDLFISFYQFTN